MDFNALSPEEKIFLIKEFVANPVWQYLLQTQRGLNIPVTDLNSKEAFYYNAIKQQGIESILNEPQNMLNRISVLQAAEQKNKQKKQK